MNLQEIINNWVGRLTNDEYQFLMEEVDVEDIRDEMYEYFTYNEKEEN
mgnify:FL=1|tara:strand:+ start:627 stop:770 length:144 start_codon:yes stop_codon:yes gene_type:complete